VSSKIVYNEAVPHERLKKSQIDHGYLPLSIADALALDPFRQRLDDGVGQRLALRLTGRHRSPVELLDASLLRLLEQPVVVVVEGSAVVRR